MSIALVMTIRNERALLRENILFHHYMGVERFYIFLDGTTDSGETTVADLPYVTVIPQVDYDKHRNRVDVQTFLPKLQENFVARQSINTVLATEMARENGYSWILSIDADELVCPDSDGCQPGQLREFLDTIPDNIESVRFLPSEIAQNRFSYPESVFRQETLFQSESAQVKRYIYDPFQKQYHLYFGFLGHTRGKCAVRLKIHSRPASSHTFVRIHGAYLNEMSCRTLLHYNIYSFDDFIKKFRNFHDHPDTFLADLAVPYVPKLLWRNLVNDCAFNMNDLASYYMQSVILKKNAIRNYMMKQFNGLPVKNPAIVRFSKVTDVFRQIEQR